MFEKGRKKGTIRFAFQPRQQKPRKVYLAGDFTDWQPVRMRRQKTGQYVAVVPVEQGEHEYKFLVDDRWLPDHDNNAAAANPFGTINSVARVK